MYFRDDISYQFNKDKYKGTYPVYKHLVKAGKKMKDYVKKD